MNMKRILALCISVVMLLTAFTACGNKEEAPPSDTAGQSSPAPGSVAETKDPLGKYDPPITLTACRILTSWMGFDEGKDVNNNWWSQMYLEKLGIKLDVVWTAANWGEPLESKIATSLATNDLPDIIPVYGSIAKKLVTADKVADLTQVYADYASEDLKTIYSISDGLPLKNATLDGKLVAMPDPQAFNPSSAVIWLRSDWLKKLGLEAPKTLEELENVAKEFTAKKPDGQAGTYGFAVGNDLRELETAMKMFHGTEGWIEKDGKLEFARIQPEQRVGLQRFAQWYKDGLLSREFATKNTENELQADIASGKVGILFEGDTAPGGGAMRALMKNKPDADWIWVPFPSADDKPVKHHVQGKVGDFNLVNKNCKNPEAVIKMTNLVAAILGPNKPDYIKDNAYSTSPGGNMEFWNSVLRFGVVQGMTFAGPAREELKNGGDGSKLNIDQKAIYDQLKAWKEKGVNDENFDLNWAMAKQYDFGGSVEYSNKLYEDPATNLQYDAFYGFETEAESKYGGELATRRKEFFINAIMNGTVDKEFDAYVDYFYKNGGEQWTKEVNEWYQANK